jgi:hypothetical protein
LVALFCTGCSVLAIRGPRTTQHGEVVCDASYVPPVIDAAIAIAGVALIVWGAGAHRDPEGHTVEFRNFAALPGVAMAVPFGLSSAYGFNKTASCQRNAREASTNTARK